MIGTVLDGAVKGKTRYKLLICFDLVERSTPRYGHTVMLKGMTHTHTPTPTIVAHKSKTERYRKVIK